MLETIDNRREDEPTTFPKDLGKKEEL